MKLTKFKNIKKIILTFYIIEKWKMLEHNFRCVLFEKQWETCIEKLWKKF
jgi:hypothetical protein